LATVANLCDEALDEFRDQMPPAACELIAAAQQRTYRMSAMIEELLAVSTADAPDEEREPVAADEVAEEALERLRPLAAEKNIELQVARPLPSVLGSRVRLREAIYNLLSNAVKFVDPQIGRVVLSGESAAQRCRLVVTDNGPGVPLEERERIFSPFRRLPAHGNRPGSGLGLYFTRMLMEQQGGRVWVEPAAGRGSRFILELPAAEG
jgi:signal transduction histidine kinase